MTRTLHLEQWAGQWVAVDAEGAVLAAGDSLREVVRIVKERQLDDVEIMRAPEPADPVAFGIG